MPVFLKNLQHYHPETTITNDDLNRVCGADPQWIVEKTGILERRTMGDYLGEFPSFEISKRCFSRWKLRYPSAIEKVKMVISASTHDDIHYPNPGNALTEDEKLSVPVFQIKTACSSVAYAIHLAKNMLPMKAADDEILIINGEVITRYIDYGDKLSCILFGDAATAFCVSPIDGDFEIIDSEIGGCGMSIVKGIRVSETSHLTVNEVTSGKLATGKPLVNRRKGIDKKFSQDGRAVMDFVLTNMPSKTEEFLKKNGLTIGDVNRVIFHQSNLMMMKALLCKLGAEEEKHIYNVDRFGNTGSAGWISVLSQNCSSIAAGDLVLASVFGAGMTWAHLLLKKT